MFRILAFTLLCCAVALNPIPATGQDSAGDFADREVLANSLDASDHSKSSTRTDDNATVFLFIQGASCSHCMDQLSVFARGLEGKPCSIVVVTPQSASEFEEFGEFSFKVVADPERTLFREVDALYPNGEPLHATLVVDAAGKIRFQVRGDEPFMDVERIGAVAERIKEGWDVAAAVRNPAERRGAERLMLMMQEMAGIGPGESAWVAGRLSDGLAPAPMHQKSHKIGKEKGSSSQQASMKEEVLVQLRRQFGPANPGENLDAELQKLGVAPSQKSQVEQSEGTKSETLHPVINPLVSQIAENSVSDPPRPHGSIRIKVLPGGADDPPENDRYFKISAISTRIVYNRFRGTDRMVKSDPKGNLFVLDKDIVAVLQGQQFFNAGHDPLFHGVGHSDLDPLYLKDPDSGEYILDDDGAKIRTLCTEPLVIRANRGERVVIDFTNRLGSEDADPSGALANFYIEGAEYDFSQLSAVAKMAPAPVDESDPDFAVGGKGYQLRYVIEIGDEIATEGTYYTHSQPVLPDNIDKGLDAMRNQIKHGLFGALIVEPPGSKYYDCFSYRIKDEDGLGDFQLDTDFGENGYVPIESGWGAIIVTPGSDGRPKVFREYAILFHDDLDNNVIEGLQEQSPRAINYRLEPFSDLFDGHFAVNDRSMAYSAYTYGDASTPHPQFYLGDPVCYRVVHAGRGSEFHVFHHHAHRWRFQPNLSEPGSAGNRANLTKPSKWGLPESPRQPDLTNSHSTRVDSQTLAPGETFDVFMEGGAGGVQRTVGDVLLHCHIIIHVTQGMWTYSRVYNTLVRPDLPWQPGLAPLPDRLTDELKPPLAVDSLTLAEIVRKDGIEIVGGGLAGTTIRNVESQLYPFIENQLPLRGIPDLDKRAHPKDTVRTNRADKWNWSFGTYDGVRLYLGEPYDLLSESSVHFGSGFPTVGEGVGVDRFETDPNGERLRRPRLLFNPRDGRLAFPHLLPQAGKRPPFAPRTRLTAVNDGSFQIIDDELEQGAAYLGATFPQGPDVPGRVDGEAIGVELGSGLAPEEAKNVRHYELVALQLPIQHQTRSGAPLGTQLGLEPGETIHGLPDPIPSGPGRKIQFKGSTQAGKWKVIIGGHEIDPPGRLQVRPGDEIEWTVDGDRHGVVFESEDKAKGILQFDAETEPEKRLRELVSDPGQGKVSSDNFPEFEKPWGNDQGFPGSAENPSLLASAKVQAPDDPAESQFDLRFTCAVHGPGSMNMTLTSEPVIPGYDPRGQIFVLRDDVGDVLAGRKPAEPLVIRANAGDIVDITLESALTDDSKSHGYSKVGIHTHLVQYDVQSSDGAVGGLNYETSIRPSLVWNEEKQALDAIESGVAYREKVHYRWWCDVELGTAYFHDHSLLKNSLPHGLFGATIVEPYGATYHDSLTGEPIYREVDGRIKSTAGVHGASTVDIRIGEGTDSATGFREFVPLFGDGFDRTINLRSESRDKRILGADGEIDVQETWWDGSNLNFLGGKETLFSSVLHGDPVTPIWRSLAGDPVRVRTEGGSTNSIHTLNIHGHRFLYERNNANSTLRDFGLVGQSEGFTFDPEPAQVLPGDYLYGGTGVRDLHAGEWGIWRVHHSADEEAAHAEGVLRVYIKRPADVDLKEGHRFVSRQGIQFLATEDVSVSKAVMERLNVSRRIAKDEVYFFDVNVRAETPGDESNLPSEIPFGTNPNPLDSESNERKPIFDPSDTGIELIVSLTEIRGGTTKLQKLPLRHGDAVAERPPEIANDDILSPAPHKERAVDFHIAALEVGLPVRNPPADPGIVKVGTDSDEQFNFFWTLGDSRSKDLSVSVKRGQKLIFEQTDHRGGHGLRILSPELVILEGDATPKPDAVLRQLPGGAGVGASVPPIAEGGNPVLMAQFEAIKDVTMPVNFECVVHFGGMKGSVEAAKPSDVSVGTASDEQFNFFWTLGSDKNKDLSVPVKKGQKLIFEQTDHRGGHGLRILNPELVILEGDATPKPDAVLKQLPGGAGVGVSVPPIAEDGEPVLMAQFEAIKNVITPVNFECVVHFGGMKGKVDDGQSDDFVKVGTASDEQFNFFWTLGLHRSRDLSVQLKKGQRLIFEQTDHRGDHGLRILDPDLVILEGDVTPKPNAVLRQLPGGAGVGASVPPIVEGGSPVLIAQFEAIKDVIKPVDFNCVVHFGGMKGRILGQTEPILAYVELTTERQRELAESITSKTRSQQSDLLDEAESEISELRQLLNERFLANPEPLVLRVNAPTGQDAKKTVRVRLCNLLPERSSNSWTSTTSLHPSLVSRDVSRMDGSAVGRNAHTLVVRGDSRTYEWTIDRELGVCHLRDMADVEHQTAGLFGAIIVEPPTASKFLPSLADDGSETPGTQARIMSEGETSGFREFVIFIHDGFRGNENSSGKFAINYQSAARFSDNPPTPQLLAHSGDPIVVRLIHSAGQGSENNHAFFLGGRRWPFDWKNSDASNHIASFALAPTAVMNIGTDADEAVLTPRRYLYGTHVAGQLTGGEWGEFVVLPRNDPRLHSLPNKAGNE